MRLFATAALLLAVAGCLDITSPDGTLTCSDVPDRACPHGFYCLGADHTCWREGHWPDMSGPHDFASPPFPVLDLSVRDLSVRDMPVGPVDHGVAATDLSSHD